MVDVDKRVKLITRMLYTCLIRLLIETVDDKKSLSKKSVIKITKIQAEEAKAKQSPYGRHA